MQAFEQLDYSRLDVKALLECRGVASVLERDVERACAWLDNESYSVGRCDFGRGIAPGVEQIGDWLRWEEQFGYQIDGNVRNLDALRDGFATLPAPRSVLLFTDVAAAWSLDREWCEVVFQIIAEASLTELALGRRFFALVVVDSGHDVPIGQTFDAMGFRPPLRF